MTARSELEKYLRQQPGGPARGTVVFVRNATTPDREATIVAAGCTFAYVTAFLPLPGTYPPPPRPAVIGDYQAGPVRTNIAPGNSATFKSSDPRRHTTTVACMVSVVFGNPMDPTADWKQFSYFAEYAGTDGIVQVAFEFRIKAAAPAAELATAEDYYELVAVAGS